MSGSVRHPKSGSARGLPDHLHHRLLKSGLSHRAAATWRYVLSVVLVAVGLLLQLYREYTQAILFLAYVAFACVIVRHLSRVELWDSGALIVQGLGRPRSKVVAVLTYPPLDLAILAAAIDSMGSSLTLHQTVLRSVVFLTTSVILVCGARLPARGFQPVYGYRFT